MNKILYFLILLLLLPLDCLPNGETQATDGAQKVNLPELIRQCEDCHGSNGYSTRNDVPQLAGKPVADFKEAMAQFYYYERHCPTVTPRSAGGAEGSSTSMCNIASTLSDAEVRALGQYFNTH